MLEKAIAVTILSKGVGENVTGGAQKCRNRMRAGMM